MFPNGEHSETFATIGVLTASLGLQTLRQVLLGKKSNDNEPETTPGTGGMSSAPCGRCSNFPNKEMQW